MKQNKIEYRKPQVKTYTGGEILNLLGSASAGIYGFGMDTGMGD